MSGQRWLLFVLVVFLALVLLASLQALCPWRLPTPEVALLIVLYLGLVGRSSILSLLLFTFVVGYLNDLFAAAPKGLSSLSLGLALLWARAASARLDVNTGWQTLLIAFITSLVHGFLVIAVTGSLYPESPWASLRLVPGTALATALLAPPLFSLLALIDRRVTVEPRGLRMS